MKFLFTIEILVLFLIVYTFSSYFVFAECQEIVVHYNERVPYMYSTNEGVIGLTASPAQNAFASTGIPFVWQLTPSKRQMKFVQDNLGCDCLVGWFKNAERERFAKYTLPIYQDKPQIAIARADNAALYSGMSVDELLSNPNLLLEVKDGYSYGCFLDEIIAQHKPNMEVVTIENMQMLRKVQSGRNDYFFMAPEEADGLIASSNIPKETFKYVTFSDMPQGEFRYVMCSEKVSDEIIQRLNAVIKEMNVPMSP